MRHRYHLFLFLLLSLHFAAAPVQADVCTPQLNVSGEAVNSAEGEPVFVDLLANDSHDCGAPLSVTLAPEGCPGFLEDYGDGSITYFPAAGEEGVCLLAYTVTASGGGQQTTTVAVSVANGGTTGGPLAPLLRIDPAVDSHRFMAEGEAVYLAGYYPGVQALLVGDPDYGLQGNHEALFDTLVDNRINLLRTVVTMGMALETHDWIHPYNRVSGGEPTYHAGQLGLASDQGRRFDLSSFNETFFDYWKDVVDAAEARGVYLQLALLDGFHLNQTNYTTGADREIPLATYGLFYNYYRPTNRSSSINSTLSFESDFYLNRTTVEAQENLVKRMVGDFCHYEGIIWELINEGDVGLSTQVLSNWREPEKTWREIMYDAVRQAEADAGCQEHLVMPFHSPDHQDLAGHWTPSGGDKPNDPLPGDDPTVDDEDLEYQIVHTALVQDFLAVYDIPDFVSGTGGQSPIHLPLIADNDCCISPGTPTQLRKKAWLSLLAGANPSMLVYDVPRRSLNDATTQRGMREVGYTRKLIQDRDIDLLLMAPRADLIEQTEPNMVWLSARGNEEYIGYLFNGGTISFVAGALPASYEAWWFNPRTGQHEAIDPVPTSGVFSKPTGAESDWALYLRNSEVSPPTNITIDSQPQGLTALVGETAIFTLSATATPSQPLTFSWTLNGQDISLLGARAIVESSGSASTLTISGLLLEDAGTVVCQVSGVDGSTATSIGAPLVVEAPIQQLPVVTERFDLSAAGPFAGDPLDGQTSDSGERTWSANNYAILGSTGGEEGYLSHPASPGDIAAVGTIPFDPITLSGATVLTVGADVAITGDGFAGVGFSPSPDTSFTSNGTLWLSLRENGDYAVYQNGTAQQLAACQTPSCNPIDFEESGASNRLKIQLDLQLQEVSAWINREKVLDRLPLTNPALEIGQLRTAGFTLNASNGGTAERIRIDNFWAVASSGPGEVEGAVIESSEVPTMVTCGTNDVAMVSLVNSGNTVWYRSEAGSHPDLSYKWGHMGSDPFTAGPRVWLLSGEKVLPGESLSFAWILTPPNQAGNFDIEWQMIREDHTAGPPDLGLNAWFGDILERAISVDCQDPNDPPVAEPDSFATSVDTDLVILNTDLLSNDYDPDPNDEPIWVTPQSLVANNGVITTQVLLSGEIEITYSPNPGFSGEDQFTYLIRDNGQLEASGQVTVAITHQPPVAGDDHILMPFQGASLLLSAEGLLANDQDPNGAVLSVVGYGTPTNGTLGLTQFGRVYVPGPDFWTLGFDSFTYDITNGLLTSQGTIHIDADTACSTYLGDDFESGDLTAWSQLVSYGGGNLSAETTAAAAGTYGLLVEPVGGTTHLYAQDDSPLRERNFRASFAFNPNDFAMAIGNEHSLFSGFTPGKNAFAIRMVGGAAGPQLRLVVSKDNNVQVLATPAELGDEFWQIWHLVSVDWWAASTPGANDGGARLWVDGLLVAEILGIDNDDRWVDSTRLGAPFGLDSGFSGTYFVDSYQSCGGTKSRQTLHLDEFESGDLSAWDAVMATGGGTTSVSSASALSGNTGLDIGLVEGAGQVHVRKDLDPAVGDLSVEFLFDPNSLAMNNGSAHPIFHVGTPSGSALSIALKQQQSEYKLQIQGIHDSGQSIFSGVSSLSDEPHALRLEFRKASTPGLADGEIHLWVDGTLAHSINNLDNANKAPNALRLGGVWLLDPGTIGNLYFDAFQAWH